MTYETTAIENQAREVGGATTEQLYHNEFLFAQAYLEQLLLAKFEQNDVDALARTLREWRRVANPIDATSMLSSFVGPVLDSIGFLRENMPSVPGACRLMPHAGAAKPVGACLVIDPASDIDCTLKGMNWSERLVRLLRVHDAPWGILTNGDTWRLYRRDELSPYDTYLQIQVGRAVDGNDIAALRLFQQFFTGAAFLPQEDGRPKLDAFRQASIKATEEIEKHLRSYVDDVLRSICMGFVQDEGKTTFDDDERKLIFDNSVYLLYRIIFVLYAESRGLLPVSSPDYSARSLSAITQLSLAHLRTGQLDRSGYELWSRLRDLFVWIDQGHRPEPGEDFEIGEYDGELFDAGQKPYISDHRISNEYVARAVYYLTCIDDKKRGDRLIDYRDISIRHLGSLYESILEYKLYIAAEPMVARASGDKITYHRQVDVELKQADQDNLIPKGGAYFAQSPDERKQSGSYYTPEDVVDYIASNTVGEGLNDLWKDFEPVLLDLVQQAGIAPTPEEAERLRRFADAEVERFVREKVFTYRVLDPAMGSGHFLVNALQRITGFVVGKLNETPWTNEGLDTSPRAWRRRIVERCMFGVDINPLATELAKLSLWLSSAAEGKPLSFLNHHLKTGNSLLGARLTDLAKLTSPKGKAESGQLPLFVMQNIQSVLEHYGSIAAADSDDISAVEDKKRHSDEAERFLTRLKDVANVWLSAFYGGKILEQEYSRLLDNVASGISRESWEALAASDRVVANAREIARRESFFHWETEFPEAAGGGECRFSVVAANPPYVASRPSPAISHLYQAAKCSDLYGWFCELGLKTVSGNGYVGMIVPLSLTFSRAFSELRSIMISKPVAITTANFDATRDGIFLPSGGSRNGQRATIFIARSSRSFSASATRMMRWYSADRTRLFDSLRYCDTTAISSKDGFPKLDDPLLAIFFQRLTGHPSTVRSKLYRRERSEDGGGNPELHHIFVPDNARYFITALPYQLKQSKINAFPFVDSWTRDVAMLAVNSNVFYWLWCVVGDGFDVTSGNVEAMALPEVPTGDAETISLRDALRSVADDCVTSHSKSGGQIPNLNFNKRMDVLLDIDDWIVRHVAPDMGIPRDAFAQYKSSSFVRPLDATGLTDSREDE